MRAWAIVGIFSSERVPAKTSVLHTNPAKGLLIVGGVVMGIEDGRGHNALGWGKHVVSLKEGTPGLRMVAYDASRRAPLATTTLTTATVAPAATVRPCRAAAPTVAPEGSLRVNQIKISPHQISRECVRGAPSSRSTTTEFRSGSWA